MQAPPPRSRIHPDLGPILILGDRGMLGREWRELLEREGFEHGAVDLPELDLTHPRSIERALGGPWRTVVNCTGYTDVDGAEADEARANQINAEGVAHVARLCAARGMKLLHYSTDYVFNGRGQAPYRPDDEVAPLGAYGRSKLAGETAVLASAAQGLVLRTSWLHAPWGKNFVLTMAHLVETRPTVRVVADQVGRPTSVRTLARISLELATKRAEGVYHVCDDGECSWFELATAVARLLGSHCVVEPCTTAEFPRPAPRPAYSVLDLAKTTAQVGVLPPWEEGVRWSLSGRPAR